MNVRLVAARRPAPPTAWPATASAPFQARRRAATSPPLWTTSTSTDRDDSFATEAAASGASRRPPLELDESEQRPTRGAGTCWLLLSTRMRASPPPGRCSRPLGTEAGPKAAAAISVLRVISRWLPRRMIAGSLRQPTMWATSGSRKPATSPAVSVATTCGPGQLLALAVQRAASGALRREPRPPLAPTGVPVRERTRGRSSAASSAQTMVRAGRRREARKRHSHQRANATGD